TSVSEGDAIENYTWKLNNQIISYDEEFAYRIAEAGLHDMALEVRTVNNCLNAMSKEIEVFLAPVSKFKAEPMRGAAPLEVTFTNQSENASSFLWDFSDYNTDQDD